VVAKMASQVFAQVIGRGANSAHSGPQWNIRLVDLRQPIESSEHGVSYHTKCHEYCFRYSEVSGGVHILTHRQQGDLLGLFLFFCKNNTST
jgi:hypothetical protein